MAETLGATRPHEVFVPADETQALPVRPAADWQAHRFAGTAMGTSWAVKAWAPAGATGEALQAAIHAQLQRTVDLFSHWHAHSEIGRFNDAPAGAFGFSEAAWPVIERSLALAQATQGAVDPTLGALIDLWGFGPAGPREPPDAAVPDAARINAALQVSGWQRVRVDAATRSLHKPAGLRLDLGGIAKGWAVDQVSAALLRAGAAVHLVEVGGELKARGLKPDLQPWWVELESPSSEARPREDGRRSLLALVDAAIATSGDGQRHFEHEGQRLAHTLDGRTGCPAGHGIATVSVLHASAMEADALATALTVMGLTRALAWTAHNGLAARITVRGAQGLSHHLSPAMQALRCTQEA
ncbi:FAD:protein FMN transferase [Xenophilus sp. Marseille-Q4582]|uniref:FAD:protein FMN transferase n=1 Tax=Xenophilus sp. Marseille-Q4582 TaxID=2866600 RepID=UPI001CE3C3B4|nr:FAD:protein FMN transferase [Xenophilus sp. Marseille-Q4582]